MYVYSKFVLEHWIDRPAAGASVIFPWVTSSDDRTLVETMCSCVSFRV